MTSAPQRTAWLLFGPPAVLAGVRWVVQAQAEREPRVPAPALQPVAVSPAWAELMWPAALVLLLFLATVWAWRRWGWQGLRRPAVALWVGVWLAGAAAVWQRQLNHQHLFLSTASEPFDGRAAVGATVVAQEFKPPSLRSDGGTLLVLQVAGQALPQRVLLADPGATAVQPGDALLLRLAPGRFSGQYLLAWKPTRLPGVPGKAAAVPSLP